MRPVNVFIQSLSLSGLLYDFVVIGADVFGIVALNPPGKFVSIALPDLKIEYHPGFNPDNTKGTFNFDGTLKVLAP